MGDKASLDHIYFISQLLADLPRNEDWMSPGEQARAAALRFAKRRTDWLLGRWTAKIAVRSYLRNIGAEVPNCPDLEIRAADDGAPEAFVLGNSAPVSLSLSHSGEQGFCAVMPSGFAPGCDLELVQPHDDVFIRDYFVDEESAVVAQVPAEERPLWATLIWCAKESALKCLREGLRRDTRSVVVELTREQRPAWSPFSVRCVETERVFQGWWRRSGAYVQTIAADVPIDQPVDLRG